MQKCDIHVIMRVKSLSDLNQIKTSGNIMVWYGLGQVHLQSRSKSNHKEPLFRQNNKSRLQPLQLIKIFTWCLEVACNIVPEFTSLDFYPTYTYTILIPFYTCQIFAIVHHQRSLVLAWHGIKSRKDTNEKIIILLLLLADLEDNCFFNPFKLTVLCSSPARFFSCASWDTGTIRVF